MSGYRQLNQELAALMERTVLWGIVPTWRSGPFW